MNTSLGVLIYVLVILAISTAMPFSATRINDLGYRSLCPFAPWRRSRSCWGQASFGRSGGTFGSRLSARNAPYLPKVKFTSICVVTSSGSPFSMDGR